MRICLALHSNITWGKKKKKSESERKEIGREEIGGGEKRD